MSTMDFTVKPVTSAQWPALEDRFGVPSPDIEALRNG